MQYYLLGLVSVLAFTFNVFGTKKYQVSVHESRRYLGLYQTLYCFIASVCFLLLSVFTGHFDLTDPVTIAAGVGFGILFFGASRLSSIAYIKGSVSLTAVIVNLSLLLPVFYSIFYLHEPFDILHGIGLSLFIACLFLSAFSQKETGKAFSPVWLILVICGLLCNGTTGIIQKHYIMVHEMPNGTMLMTFGYSIATLCFLLTFLFERVRIPKQQLEFVGADARKTLILALVSGAGSFVGNMLITYLSDKLPGPILFPLVNGGLCMSSSLVSFFYFKEKPTVMKWIAIICGACAVVILSISSKS